MLGKILKYGAIAAGTFLAGKFVVKKVQEKKESNFLDKEFNKSGMSGGTAYGEGHSENIEPQAAAPVEAKNHK